MSGPQLPPPSRSFVGFLTAEEDRPPVIDILPMTEALARLVPLPAYQAMRAHRKDGTPLPAFLAGLSILPEWLDIVDLLSRGVWPDDQDELWELADDASRLAEDLVEMLGGADEQAALCTAPPAELPQATPVQTRAALLSTVRMFFDAAEVERPRVLIGAITGAGKTEITGKLLAQVIPIDRRDGRPYRTILAVPTHKLGRKVGKRFAKQGLDVAVLEGRGDPHKPATAGRRYQCRNLEAVGLAIQAGADVRKTVCGTGKGGCPFFAACSEDGYLSQFKAAGEADVLIVAHSMLFERLPKSLLHDVAQVIIDEDPTALADVVSDLTAETFSAHAVAAFPVLDKAGEADPIDTDKLSVVFGEIARRIDASPDGFADAAIWSEEGLTTADLNYARHLNWKRRRDVRMTPGMSMEARREAARAAGINALLPRLGRLLQMLAIGEYGRIRFFSTASRGGYARGLVVHGQREVAKWTVRLPVMILSATARLDDVRRMFPDATQADIPQPKLEHQSVFQILGGFGKGPLSCAVKLAALVDDVRLKALSSAATLVLVHQQHEAAFQGIPGVVTRHHGDISGDDDFGSFDLIIQIGGPFASAKVIAELATARSGRPVEIARAVRAPCHAVLEDGSRVKFERMAYTDPDAQAAHTGIYDAAFVQGGLGRGRGINRTAESPLQIVIYGNVPLPVPVVSVTRWRDSRPGLAEKLVLDRWIWGNASLAAQHSKRISSAAAFNSARRRLPDRDLIEAVRPIVAALPDAHSAVALKLRGRGQRMTWVILPTADVPELHRLLERHHGGVVAWEVKQFTPGTKPAREVSVTSNTEHIPQMTPTSPMQAGEIARMWVLPAHPPPRPPPDG